MPNVSFLCIIDCFYSFAPDPFQTHTDAACQCLVVPDRRHDAVSVKIKELVKSIGKNSTF